ncbi:hypothetical protein U9M48_021581 [Paspalum notatum var. saurae]|uniref:Uncharacterized protein n=1 Tax=Paspalum notatum var. saurae TaxID=547442 RepID=A0AAQ3TJB7_PASNO
MVGACGVAVASPAVAVAAGPNSNLASRRRGFLRMSCRHSLHLYAAARSSGRVRSSRREPGEAETDSGVPRILKEDDSGYIWTLGLGSVGGAAVIKYGSILLPDITRPNIVLALLMVSLPVVAAVLILLKASSAAED